MDRAEVMGIVQRRWAPSAPDLPNGFAEHTTMGAEAMLTLGLDPDRVLEWADRHEPAALGADSPLPATRDAIAAELAEGDWVPVLRRHVVPLAGRLDAHLFHGLIRTAHATRALEHHDDTDARAELATGLAAWSVWAGAAHDVEPGDAADPLAAVLEMARRGAGAFVTAPSIFTLHAVTAPMAYLLVAEHLDPDTHAVAAAVFRRTHGRHATPPVRNEHAGAPSADELARLTGEWDAHPAKLVEAATRGLALTGDPVFAEAAATVLPGPPRRSG